MSKLVKKSINEIMKDKRNQRCGVSSREGARSLFAPVFYKEKEDVWVGYTYVKDKHVLSETLCETRRGSNSIYIVKDKRAVEPHINTRLHKLITYARNKKDLPDTLSGVETLSNEEIRDILNLFKVVYEKVCDSEIQRTSLAITPWQFGFLRDSLRYLTRNRYEGLSIKQKLIIEDIYEAILPKLEETGDV